MMKKERMDIGIPGFNELIGGGLIPKTLTLLTGTTGTGKTMISTQFIFSGLNNYDQKGVYITFEEPPEDIKSNALGIGMDFEPFEKKNKMVFVKYDPFHVEDIYELIETNIKKINAERVVIDSVSALGLYVKDVPEIRRMIFNIAFMLRKLGCTSILISEIPPQQETLSRFGVEEFVTDNVFVLYYTRTGSQFSRSITIWKMRASTHSSKIHPYRITENGVTIYPKEEAFMK
jgi:KaiC/GvpD/RAD55 family RecA-like ATPase